MNNLKKKNWFQITKPFRTSLEKKKTTERKRKEK